MKNIILYTFIGFLLGGTLFTFLYSIGIKPYEKTIYVEIEKCKQLGGNFWYYQSGDKLYCDLEERIEIK